MIKSFGVFLSIVLAASMLAGCGGATGAVTSQKPQEAVEAGAEAAGTSVEAEAAGEAGALMICLLYA